MITNRALDTPTASNAVREALHELKSQYRKATEELTKASHKLAEEIYRQATAKQQGQPGGGGQAGPEQPQGQPGKDDDIVDAEVVDDDDKGKR